MSSNTETFEYTLREHLAELPAHTTGQTQLALFDMDRTLISGFSVLALLLEWVRDGSTSARQIASEMLASRRTRSTSRLARYRQLVGILEGESDEHMRQLGELAFHRSVAASIFREARELVAAHRALGHEVGIITAATQYQVAPVARALGIEHIYCSELETIDGELTGKFVSDACYGEKKANAARRLARSLGASLNEAWFYTDSEDDLPLLRLVGFPVATNPSSTLAEEAVRRDWPTLRFCSRGKPSVETILRTVLTANSVLTAAAAGATSWLMSRDSVRAANKMTGWLGDVGAATAGLDFEISGTAHLESVRPAVFVFNHQSFLDSVVMAHLLRHDFVAMVKQEMAENRLLGPILRAHGTIFVDRSARDQSNCLTQARQAVADGKSLVIAPEGTRSPTGQVLQFKAGAF
ncbi:MAG: HAD-IB family hydrolase, partial [Pseudomonadota bacterium]